MTHVVARLTVLLGKVSAAEVKKGGTVGDISHIQ